MDIAGKDFFTVDEAAHYAGVSVSQFYAYKSKYRLDGRKFMGKVLYRKEDIKAAIEAEFYGAGEGRVDYSTLYVPD